MCVAAIRYIQYLGQKWPTCSGNGERCNRILIANGANIANGTPLGCTPYLKPEDQHQAFLKASRPIQRALLCECLLRWADKPDGDLETLGSSEHPRHRSFRPGPAQPDQTRPGPHRPPTAPSGHIRPRPPDTGPALAPARSGHGRPGPAGPDPARPAPGPTRAHPTHPDAAPARPGPTLPASASGAGAALG